MQLKALAKFSSITLGLALIAILSNCTSGSEDQSTNGSEESSPEVIFKSASGKSHFIYGDTLKLMVRPVDSTLKVSQVWLDANDNPLTVAIEPDKEGYYHIPSQAIGGGNIRLRATLDYEGGKQSRKYLVVSIASNITPVMYGYNITHRFPHNTRNFTEGLFMYNGNLYESTGNYGQSRLIISDLNSGKELNSIQLDKDFFGEGIAHFKDKLYQLTYKAGKGFIYDLNTLQKKSDFTFNSETAEGWGFTSNDTSLIMSDGSSNLYFLNPDNLKQEKELNVFDDRGEVQNLNELEIVGDTIYANIYTEYKVAKIDLRTGRVWGYIDCTNILKRSEITNQVDVMNGIAIDPVNGRLLLTGKYWPYIYEITQTRLKSSKRS